MLETADEWDYIEHGLKGVALINIQKRIREKYGKDYGLILQGNDNDGLTVTVRLPIIRKTL
jgi:sensor histidine kinase YesM